MDHNAGSRLQEDYNRGRVLRRCKYVRTKEWNNYIIYALYSEKALEYFNEGSGRNSTIVNGHLRR